MQWCVITILLLATEKVHYYIISSGVTEKFIIIILLVKSLKRSLPHKYYIIIISRWATENTLPYY